jgi:hypothetical protein
MIVPRHWENNLTYYALKKQHVVLTMLMTQNAQHEFHVLADIFGCMHIYNAMLSMQHMC